MPHMRAVQVTSANGPFELVERPIPEPAPGRVRIKVQACGVCHSDAFTKLGAFPGIQYPRVPGHEVVGTIDAVGQSACRAGGKGSASASDGMAVIAVIARPAGAAISSPAQMARSPASPMTAVMPTT